jgi:hypothetical protein
VHILHALLTPQPLSFNSFFIKKRFDANTTGFRTKMTAQGIGSSKTTATTPLAALFELSLANKLLLSGMKTLVPLPVMLAGKRFATYCAYEWTLISMSTQM